MNCPMPQTPATFMQGASSSIDVRLMWRPGFDGISTGRSLHLHRFGFYVDQHLVADKADPDAVIHPKCAALN